MTGQAHEAIFVEITEEDFEEFAEIGQVSVPVVGDDRVVVLQYCEDDDSPSSDDVKGVA